MGKLMLAPPVAFIIMLAVSACFAMALSHLSFRRKGPDTDIDKSYACGEDVPTHLMQPDYSQFFPFAFFFTVLHVVALIITTVPTETIGSFAIAVIYIAGALVGMSILFRR
jgi:NADH:ubiquinone oxidoreductase subunit 3 (subunit A)